MICVLLDDINSTTTLRPPQRLAGLFLLHDIFKNDQPKYNPFLEFLLNCFDKLEKEMHRIQQSQPHYIKGAQLRLEMKKIGDLGEVAQQSRQTQKTMLAPPKLTVPSNV